MLKKLSYGTALFLLMLNSAFAQLPDFTELVKNNGAAVVNISTTQKAPEQSASNDQQLPPDLPPEMEELFKQINKPQAPKD